MTLAAEPYVDLPFTVNRQARRQVQRSRAPMTVKLKVTRIHTVSDIPMTVSRLETPAEVAKMTAWQAQVAEIMRANEGREDKDKRPLPMAPYNEGDLQVPANVVTLMRRFLFDSRPANIDESVTAFDLFRKLRDVSDSARTVEVTDLEHEYVMAVVNIVAVQSYGLNAPAILHAFQDVVHERGAKASDNEPTPITAHQAKKSMVERKPTAARSKTTTARKPARSR